MIPINDNPPPGVIDRRDGNTKGECGITTVGCLFCKDQISASRDYVENYDSMAWAPKDGCQIATCPFWQKPDCWQAVTGAKSDPKKYCPVWRRRQAAGRWDIERYRL